MQYPPIFDRNYTTRDKAVIAGFLLHFREGYLRALESVSGPEADQIPSWKARQTQYYQDAESITRYLLCEVGYPVEKGDVWTGGDSVHYP